jgi:serine protease Do
MNREILRKSALGLAALAITLGTSLAATAANPPLTPREIYKTYGKGVVLVFATDGSAQGSAGTGSVITEDGQVITNAHVVSKDGRPYKKLFVYLKPDKLQGSMQQDLKLRFAATLMDLNPELDLALLKIVEPPKDLTVIQFVDPDEVEIGEPVVAIGHPETGGLWTLTTGSISSVIADFQGVTGKHVFQTEASVNRGNSGGPLLNAYGHMVGINTCISRKAADGLAITDINFSLKSSVAVDWLANRKLMNLAYVAPDYLPDALRGAAVAGTTVAMAETKPETRPETKPNPTTVSQGANGQEKYEVDSGDGKTLVVVVEPEKGQEVADDPEFAQAAQDTETVSRNMKGANTAKPGKAAADKAKAKHLTKARPYKMDQFVSERVKEMRKMEKMMDDMSDTIQRKTGKGKSKVKDKSKGMGIW